MKEYKMQLAISTGDNYLLTPFWVQHENNFALLRITSDSFNEIKDLISTSFLTAFKKEKSGDWLSNQFNATEPAALVNDVQNYLDTIIDHSIWYKISLVHNETQSENTPSLDVDKIKDLFVSPPIYPPPGFGDSTTNKEMVIEESVTNYEKLIKGDINSFFTTDKIAIDESESLKPDGVKSFTVVENKSEYLTYPIFFSTNRKAVEKEDAILDFNGERNNGNNYGKCNVSIPRKHKQGNVERPSFWTFGLTDPSPKKHMTILSCQVYGKADFIHDVKSNTSKNEQEILLFVHGYNTSFEESIWRTAQLAYDLGIDGAAVNYSWPSRGSIPGYFSDEASAEHTIPYFKDFLKALLAETAGRNMNIIAHSMGNRVVGHALKELAKENCLTNSSIKHLIMAAADIDADVFKKQIAPAFSVLKRVTLYASDHDKALTASEVIRSGYPRAGQAGERICVVDYVDTVDATYVSTDLLGHGYFASTKSLLDDIFMVLKNDLKPDKRNLRLVKSGELVYWTFPHI
jgi:esterase/lipase superfamily enzyme